MDIAQGEDAVYIKNSGTVSRMLQTVNVVRHPRKQIFALDIQYCLHLDTNASQKGRRWAPVVLQDVVQWCWIFASGVGGSFAAMAGVGHGSARQSVVDHPVERIPEEIWPRSGQTPHAGSIEADSVAKEEFQRREMMVVLARFPFFSLLLSFSQWWERRWQTFIGAARAVVGTSLRRNRCDLGSSVLVRPRFWFGCRLSWLRVF